MLIDTHSHIYLDDFSEDADEVIARAQTAGIGKIFLPNINVASIEPMNALAARYPGYLYPMMGLHPEDVGDDWAHVLDEMEALIAERANPYIAVGEVGLDFYWDRTYAEAQQQAFARQVGWALAYDLPLMIHCRKAQRELLAIIDEVVNSKSSNRKSSNRKLSGVFHCFSGSPEEAAELLRYEGFMLGIGGVVTFKNAKLPATLRSTVPLSRIVLETDAPFLAPVPHRGHRNESAFVAATAAKVAEVYGVSIGEVYEQTTQNALRTFGKAR